MVQKDDYYSSISSANDDAPKEDKKLKIRKKLKVKKVEVTKEDSSQQAPLQEQAPSWDSQAISLNQQLEQNEKKSSFQVVLHSQEEHHEDKVLWEKEPEYTPQEIQEKKAPKFKPWFSQKWSLKSPTGQDERKAQKKSRLSPVKKSQKHKNSIDEDAWFVRSNKIKNKKKIEKNINDIEQNLTTRTWETVVVHEVLSLKEFSEKIWVTLPKLIAEFMKNGMMMTINSKIDFDTASLIAEAFEVKLEKDTSAGISASEIVSGNIKELLAEEDTSKLQSRPPVISIMGHVDHGKTSLLDYIRQAKVADGEAGWITQSIGAYQVESGGRKITFLDTPGHEAFTIMRSRWAKSTDIAILVVAADEWVKPQTLESISHAREADIPIIVAINKMDKQGANPDHVKGQLAEQGLTPEDWWGQTPMVPVSAHTGFGIDELLEIILLVADMQELSANPERNAVATVIESHLDTKLGPVATLLINTGTIHSGDAMVCGASYGKIKLMRDYTGQAVRKWFPWEPILVVGLDKVIEGWDIVQVMPSIDKARSKSIEYSHYLTNQKKLQSSQLDILMSRIKSGNLKHLKVVLKADTNGSLEAIKNAIVKLSTEETSVSVIHSWVGNITEGDILMCGGSSAILVAFGTGVDPNAKKVLEESGIEFIESKIIYHITERIEKIVTGMLDPKEREISLCEARVGGIFYTSKKFLIVGLQMTSEEVSIELWASVRVIRWDKMIGKGKIEWLKQWVEEVKSLQDVTECWIKLTWVQDVQEKDTIEVYKIIIE